MLMGYIALIPITEEKERFMGVKLKKAFDIAKDNGGIQSQMRLAMKTGITSDKAEKAPDSAEVLKKAEEALKDITGKNVKL